MKLKEIVFGFALTASTLNGETLQELVKRECPKEKLYPESQIYRQTMWKKILDPKVTLIVNESEENKMVTEIVLYRISQGKEGLEVKGAITIIDVNSDRKFGPGDFVCYTSTNFAKTYEFSEATPQVTKDFYEIYDVAESSNGIVSEEKEERRKSGGRLPVS